MARCKFLVTNMQSTYERKYIPDRIWFCDFVVLRQSESIAKHPWRHGRPLGRRANVAVWAVRGTYAMCAASPRVRATCRGAPAGLGDRPFASFRDGIKKGMG